MTWDVSPIMFSVLGRDVRWYGVLFATGFALCYVTLRKVFPKEGRSIEELDQLLMYVLIGTVAGARLGHCLFYEPERYLENPLEILFVWQGGLASHGGALGILVSIWLFAWKRKFNPSVWWLWDRVCLTVPIAGACVRLGNFFNSEIIGRPTDMPWSVIFSRVDEVPRHPSQLYEALSYLLIFGYMLWDYWRRDGRIPKGYFLGLCIASIFSVRILIEFTKENQEAFEASLPLNMGQLLSIPFVVIGIWLMWRSTRRKPV